MHHFSVVIFGFGACFGVLGIFSLKIYIGKSFESNCELQEEKYIFEIFSDYEISCTACLLMLSTAEALHLCKFSQLYFDA